MMLILYLLARNYNIFRYNYMSIFAIFMMKIALDFYLSRRTKTQTICLYNRNRIDPMQKKSAQAYVGNR